MDTQQSFISYNSNGNIMVSSLGAKYFIFKISPNLEKHSETAMDEIANKIINKTINRIRVLDNTNLLLILNMNTVSKISNNVVLWDDSFKRNMIEINLKDDIKNIFIVRDHLIFIMERMVCVFDYKGNLLHSRKTYCNELGVGYASDNLIATLGETKGTVLLWFFNREHIAIIDAHNNNIQSITFSHDETLLATASEMGTNIHVFDIQSKVMLYKLRRGINNVKIYSMSISFDNELLACSSDSRTVHIFKLEDNKVINTLTTFTSLPDIFNTSNTMNWSFSQIQIDENTRTELKFGKDKNLNIATFCGSYYKTNQKTNYMNVIKRDLAM